MSSNYNLKKFFFKKDWRRRKLTKRNLYFIFEIVYGRFYHIKFFKQETVISSYREIVNSIITWECSQSYLLRRIYFRLTWKEHVKTYDRCSWWTYADKLWHKYAHTYLNSSIFINFVRNTYIICSRKKKIENCSLNLEKICNSNCVTYWLSKCFKIIYMWKKYIDFIFKSSTLFSHRN